MPIYQYHCTSCGVDFEIFQRMADPALTDCPECAGGLRKVFSPVGIVFKGSGFYATDSKTASSSLTGTSSKAAASSGETAGSGEKESSSSETPGSAPPLSKVKPPSPPSGAVDKSA